MFSRQKSTSNPAEAGDVQDLRRQLEQARQEAEAATRARDDQFAERLAVEAKAFAVEMVLACKATPGERPTMVDAFTLAARDDHERPMPGKPGARQEALRAVYQNRVSHHFTTELIASDPARQTRAMGMDPADEQEDTPEAAERKELDQIDADAREWAATHYKQS